MEELNFHITSINTNCLDQDKMAQLLKLKNYDIILIQKTHNRLTKEMIRELEAKMDVIVVTNDSKYNETKAGVATIISN